MAVSQQLTVLAVVVAMFCIAGRQCTFVTYSFDCYDLIQVRGKSREECIDNTGRRSPSSGEHHRQMYSFYNSDHEADSSDDSSQNHEEELEDVEEQGYADPNELVPGYLYSETEAEKRKERRHAKKAKEREGDRRRREGKPRNYLLVDEYTKKPYGAGVNDWRKEVMLLSRKLDPAIGQINKQPEDVVKEIGEWIQQTWEYSTPIKFEVVKEVIARGVSLRRSELWKKIRNKEPKPQDVTDRAWRSLKRELENPATIKKSISCSKANASRVNFGRTGPSGEVGVRERLRKMLRRSPDPEEIQFEMARDKGYGGRSKRKQTQDMTEEQIASNPFVLKLMERLVALEDSLKTKSAEVAAVSTEKVFERVVEPDNEYMESEAHIVTLKV